jgi:hypothetical protein
MNFDLATAEPFLIRCEANLKIGLDVDFLMYVVEQTEIDMGSETEIKVRYGGTPVALTFRTFRDDVEAVNLYFVTQNQALAEAINAEMLAYAEDNDL